MAEHPHTEVDEDLELALRLHRELNAVPRRQRAQPRAQAASAALRTLSKKHARQDSSESSSESEDAEERSSQQKRRRGSGAAPSGERRGSGWLGAVLWGWCWLGCQPAVSLGCPRLAQCTARWRLTQRRLGLCLLSRLISPDIRLGRRVHGASKRPPPLVPVALPQAGACCPFSPSPPPAHLVVRADNDSGSKRKRQRGEGGGSAPRKAAGARPANRTGRKPPAAAAAGEARRKAAAAAAYCGPRTHVKCFYAGLQYGCWLAVEALASRASLAAAVSHAFKDDGVSCSASSVTVVFVPRDTQGSAEFPPAGVQQQPKQERGGAAAGQQAAYVKAEAAGGSATVKQEKTTQQPKDEPGQAQHDSKAAEAAEGTAVKQENGTSGAAAAVKREAEGSGEGGNGSAEGSGRSDVSEAARWEAAARAAVRVYVR